MEKNKCTYETMLSMKIEGRSVCLEKNVLVTAVYIPPSHSRYAKLDHYDQVENMLLNHVNDYHLLCGDFNAHTGTMRDSILVSDNDGSEFVGINNDNFTDFNALGFSVERYNQDTMSDRSSYGRKLVELCKNNDVYIFNGKFGDDKGLSKVTTTYNTTLDYVIGSPLLMKYVTQFKILDFDNMYSDVHCGLHT